MSHSPERSEKVCLNCNIPIHGPFCHQCGQENREPKESVWALITHFFYDITHFDGKFFSTLKYLVLKPGFLSSEYIKGRRASYLNPIRMYVFTSALFFIIFFSAIDLGEVNYNKSSASTDSTSVSSESRRSSPLIKGAVTKVEDSLPPGAKYALRFAKNKKDSLDIIETLVDTSGGNKKDKQSWGISYDASEFRTMAAYDSAQKSLPADKRDGWIKRLIRKRQITWYEKYGNDDKTIIKLWFNTFVHQFPKLLFVSLPLFALILKLLYIRRKNFYYVDHGMFSIHLYIFTFVILLLVMLVIWLSNITGWDTFFGFVQAGLWLYVLYYTYKAMRNFYRQGRGKTIVKFILLGIMAQICIIILFAVFFILSAFQL